MGIGWTEFILIIFVALLLFGPSKLPELGKAAGKTLREFKLATKGILDEEEKNEKIIGSTVKSANYRFFLFSEFV